ncbi:hypothetical protein WA026_015138 [Henosepilachna vigintioctopunctata]|uniref:Uncharacterized protein n=1 Tax=Henosepilachna vigintioctopunctata TaxID=420089 RepID=A0AAW1TXL7_9CUCU
MSQSQTDSNSDPATASGPAMPTSSEPGPSSGSSDRKRSHPVKQPSQRLKTSIQFDIANKTSLSELSHRFTPVNPPPEAPAPKSKSTYFEKLDVAVRMELDHGTQHIIDVQPDFRFPFQYFMYNVTEHDLTVKSHPFVSTFNLIAYEQILLNAYILIRDLHSREIVSQHAAKYKNTASKMDFLTKLFDCYVPADLEPILSAFAPTYDPQRRLQLYVPSFAGFEFELDLGRIISPSMICTPPPCKPNFLGGYFDANQRPHSHSNWLNSRFEKIFNPVIGRALLQRPTLAKVRLTPNEYDFTENVDPYEFLLCYSEDNLEKILELLTDVSSFFKEEAHAIKKLGQVLENSSRIVILYH